MQQLRQPPILHGTEKEQLVQMRQYLYQISRDLNVALANIATDNTVTYSGSAQEDGKSLSESQKEQKKSEMGALKSLIIKTAHTVEAEIDRIEKDLKSTYLAVSDFGDFQENINTTISATAASVESVIDYQATIKDFIINSNGYIKQGIVGYDGALPKIGIAIGQDLTASGKEEVNGKEYDIIDVSNLSVWTPEKLSFYVAGTEAAYVSNGAFSVTQKLILGNKWEITCENGFSIKWIGG